MLCVELITSKYLRDESKYDKTEREGGRKERKEEADPGRVEGRARELGNFLPKSSCF